MTGFIVKFSKNGKMKNIKFFLFLFLEIFLIKTWASVIESESPTDNISGNSIAEKIHGTNEEDGSEELKYCEDDVSYKNHSVDIIQDASLTAKKCQTLCRSQRHCHAWTYSHGPKHCELTYSVNNVGVTSGNLNCKILPRVSKNNPDKTEEDTDETNNESCLNHVGFVGTNVGIIKYIIKSPLECQQFCLLDDRCSTWTFRKDKKACYLMEKIKIGRYYSNSMAYSGDKQCISTQDKFKDETSTEFDIDDVASCSKKCNESEDCELWKYDPQNREQCFIKMKSETVAKTLTDETDTDKGNNPPNPLNGPPCLLNKIFLRGSYNQISTSGKQTCKTACNNDLHCSFWSFHNNTKECHFHNRLAQGTAIPQRGCSCGRYDCIFSGQ